MEATLSFSSIDYSRPFVFTAPEAFSSTVQYSKPSFTYASAWVVVQSIDQLRTAKAERIPEPKACAKISKMFTTNPKVIVYKYRGKRS